MERKENSPALIRGLGLWAATAIVVGSMVGQSVFLVAADMSRAVGSEEKVLAAWIIGGLVVLFGALCYSELGAAMPEAGGDYVYLTRGLSRVWGFLYGWTSATIMRPASSAVIAAGIMRFVAFLVPSTASALWTWNLFLPFRSTPNLVTFTAGQAGAAVAIAIVTFMNYLGVRTAGRFQVVLTGLKIAVVAVILILALTAKSPGPAVANVASLPTNGVLLPMLSALVPAMLAYNGFQFIGAVGAEVRSPAKTLPWALILGTATVAAVYVCLNWVYFHVLGFEQVAASPHVASSAMARLVGDSGARWFTLAMIVSAFGSLHANFLTAPRIPYAMAADGNFFKFAKRIHPRYHTPGGAVIFQGCVAILLVLSGTYQELYSYDIFVTWIFLALTGVALIRLRRICPEMPRPFRVWGYPFTPLVFSMVALAIAGSLWLQRPYRSSIGIALILLGLPFFYYWRERKRGAGPDH